MRDDVPSVGYIRRQPLVGIDTKGGHHHFDQYHDTVYVLDDSGGLDHVEELAPGRLGAWVEYVASRRGWRDCRFKPDGGVADLARRLSAQLEHAG